MSNINDDFNEFYKEELLGSIAAPREVTERYCFQACLKDSTGKQTFLVRSRIDGKEFILKRASSENESELKNEFETLLSLQNASLPKAIHYYEESHHFYMLREYVKGTTLYHVVEENGVYEEQKAIEIAIAVCRSLNYLHHQTPPIIHRDVKPQNIILTPEGRVVLIDMGTVRRLKTDAHYDTIFMGTQATAAPEQYGFGQTDERCDIYAVGVLLVFLVTGGFASDKKILQTINKPLQKVIHKCIAIDRSKRYPNINSLKLHLESCMTKRKRLIEIYKKIALGIVFFSAGVVLTLTASKSESVQPPVHILTASAQTETSSSVTEQAVVFDYPLIEKAVRLDLGKNDEDTITESELDKVKQVMICGEVVFNDIAQYLQYRSAYTYNGEPISSNGDIFSLDDIARLKNLETLILDKQNICDINALKALPIKTLSLCGNKISDISVLQTCKGLSCLRLYENRLTDISSIYELKRLEILDISSNPITDLTPLLKLPIRELYLFDIRVVDYALLKDFPVLEILGIDKLNPEQVDHIGTLYNLKKLFIYESGIKTLSVLSNLTELDHLDVYSNELSDIEGIGAFRKVKFLSIANNQIEDIMPLTEIPKLEGVVIEYNDIVDYSALLKLQYMKNVFCDKDQSEEINKLSEELPFMVYIKS